MSEQPVVRVVRYRLDERALRPAQADGLAAHAGTSRAVWNWAVATWRSWDENVTAHVRAAQRAQAGVDQADTVAELGEALVRAHQLWQDQQWRRRAYEAAYAVHGHPREFEHKTALQARFYLEAHAAAANPDNPEGRFGWWVRNARGTAAATGEPEHGVSTYAMQDTLTNFERAVARYRSTPPRYARNGRRLGRPRFHSRRDPDQGFSIQNVVTLAQDRWRVVSGGHRIQVPSLGSLRVQENTRRLRCMIRRGGRVTSARFTRRGSRWYVALVVQLPAAGEGRTRTATGAIRPARPDRRQRAGGVVGVDLGVSRLATLSTGEVVDNPRRARALAGELARLQRRLDRQHRAGSPACFDEHGHHRRGRCQWRDAMSRRARLTLTQVTRLHTDLATERSRVLHLLTKRLATAHEAIAVEDLNVAGMTATPLAKPEPDSPGGFLANGRAAKRGLNKAILDVGFGEFRRQLEYKTRWTGASTVVVARFAPTSKTCSSCGAVRAKLRLDERTYTCDACGLVIDRDLNAALNIRALAAWSAPPTESRAGPTSPPPAAAGGGSVEQTPTGVTGAREGPLIPAA